MQSSDRGNFLKAIAALGLAPAWFSAADQPGGRISLHQWSLKQLLDSGELDPLD
jgi:hypothetical protein